MAEPFTTLLADLVGRVDGSLGAAFIDSNGEAVQAYAAGGDVDYIRLMGAYQGIALQTSRGIIKQLEAGKVDYLFTSYDRASFLIKALDHNYFLMLVLDPAASIGRGVFNICRSADAFNREI